MIANELPFAIATNDVVQIIPDRVGNFHFQGKVAGVDEVYNWGIRARVEQFEGDAYIRLSWKEFVRIGQLAYLREPVEDNKENDDE